MPELAQTWIVDSLHSSSKLSAVTPWVTPRGFSLMRDAVK